MQFVKCFSLVFLLLIGCGENQQLSFEKKEDKIWHYSVIDAMRRGIYNGEMSIKELKKHGDFGLGTFNQLNGELIALDGVIYRIQPSGIVEVAKDSFMSPFTSMSFFKADIEKTVLFTGNFMELQKLIIEMLPSKNIPYAIKVETEWEEVLVGGSNPVSKNVYTDLSVLMKSRPQYKGRKVKGTMVGYFTPTLMNNIDLSPTHFHFISEDKKFAGHIMSGILKNKEIIISIDEKKGFNLELPVYNERFKTLFYEVEEEKSTY